MFAYKIQRGVLPYALLFIGMITIMYSGTVLFLLLAKPIILRTLELPNDFKQRILFYLSAIPLFVFGFYLTSIFPRIKLTRGGLKYRSILFYGQLRWNEIDNLFEMKNGTILISINPKRFFLFKGLLFQRLTGVFLGHKYPVLLLAPGLEQRDQIVEEIMTNSLVKKVRIFGDPNS
jgi:hypothetical protein